MAVDIGPKIGIDGEAQFRKELQNINQSIKTLGSEMQLTTAKFEANGKQQKYVREQSKNLKESISAQKEKIAMLKQAVAESTAKYGENDAATQKWKQALADANTKLVESKDELKNLKKGLDETGESLGDAEEKSAKFSESLKTGMAAAGAAIAAVAAAAAAAAAAVAKAAIDTAYFADDLNTLSKTSGVSTEELQKFQFASELIDVSVDTLTGSMSKLKKNMYSAKNGTGSAAASFEALGIAVTDSNGELRDANTVFDESIRALGEIQNETERDAVAMTIFGKSASDLNPLIEGGIDNLQAYGEKAEKMGLILSQDALDGANKLSDGLDELKASGTALVHVLTAGLAEEGSSAVGELVDMVQSLAKAFSEGGWEGLVTQIGQVLTQVVQSISNMLPQLLRLGMTMLGTLIQGVLAELPSLIRIATDLIVTLTTTLLGMLPELLNVGIESVMQLVNGIAEALPELIPVAIDAILQLVETLTDPDNIGQLVDAAIAITLALANGLVDYLPKLLEKAPVIVANLVTAIVENVPKLLSAAAEVITTLVQGLIDNLPQIGQAAGQIIGTLVQGVKDLVVQLWETGKSIVDGIWQGIQDNWADFEAKISGFFTGIVDGVKSTLGIHSPSTVFAGIGKNMAAGVGVGFANEMERVERDITDAIPTPEASFGRIMAGAVNGIGTMMSAGAAQPVTINLVTADGAKLATWLLPDLRRADRLSPEVG